MRACENAGEAPRIISKDPALTPMNPFAHPTPPSPVVRWTEPGWAVRARFDAKFPDLLRRHANARRLWLLALIGLLGSVPVAWHPALSGHHARSPWVIVSVAAACGPCLTLSVLALAWVQRWADVTISVGQQRVVIMNRPIRAAALEGVGIESDDRGRRWIVVERRARRGPSSLRHAIAEAVDHDRLITAIDAINGEIGRRRGPRGPLDPERISPGRLTPVPSSQPPSSRGRSTP